MYCQIAIDGPAGAGKSTIAKIAASRLGYVYIDTGAMYRAMALYLIRSGAGKEDVKEFGRLCQGADISIEYREGEQTVILNGENVTPLLRTEEVGNMASVSSADPKVREKLLDLQRKLAASMSVVMDGRDIGTTILPDADVKIYLTASSQKRAERRYKELTEKGIACCLDEIRMDIEERDRRDMNREISPLRQAEDAVLVDSSDMTIEEVTKRILQICREKFSLSDREQKK